MSAFATFAIGPDKGNKRNIRGWAFREERYEVEERFS